MWWHTHIPTIVIIQGKPPSSVQLISHTVRDEPQSKVHAQCTCTKALATVSAAARPKHHPEQCISSSSGANHGAGYSSARDEPSSRGNAQLTCTKAPATVQSAARPKHHPEQCIIRAVYSSRASLHESFPDKASSQSTRGDGTRSFLSSSSSGANHKEQHPHNYRSRTVFPIGRNP